MQVYLDFLKDILENGEDKPDRTNTGIRSVFARQMRFDLSEKFPLLTTKNVHFKSVVHELLWFIKGDTNTKYLQENGVRIWNEWADENGNLGPVYGKQWRAWETEDGRVVDQLYEVIQEIKQNPNSRRLIVSAWNVGDLEKMALPPCHAFFQFYVLDGKLSCNLTQRSADAFLGVPFNIASYSLLTIMVAKQCGLEPGEFIWSGGDCHIYHNHFEQVKEQLSRKPKELPALKILQKRDEIDQYEFEDFELSDYSPHPKIIGKVAI